MVLETYINALKELLKVHKFIVGQDKVIHGEGIRCSKSKHAGNNRVSVSDLTFENELCHCSRLGRSVVINAYLLALQTEEFIQSKNPKVRLQAVSNFKFIERLENFTTLGEKAYGFNTTQAKSFKSEIVKALRLGEEDDVEMVKERLKLAHRFVVEDRMRRLEQEGKFGFWSSYAPEGDSLSEIYFTLTDAGLDDAAIIKNMMRKIRSLDAGKAKQILNQHPSKEAAKEALRQYHQNREAKLQEYIETIKRLESRIDQYSTRLIEVVSWDSYHSVGFSSKKESLVMKAFNAVPWGETLTHRSQGSMPFASGGFRIGYLTELELKLSTGKTCTQEREHEAHRIGGVGRSCDCTGSRLTAPEKEILLGLLSNGSYVSAADAINAARAL